MRFPVIPVLPGLSAVAERYDGYILDLWGVIHDGQQVFPWVLDTLERLKAAGKRTVLLSNAPRREAVVGERNIGIGLPEGLTHGLVTSGEEAWQHLVQRPDAFYRGLGRRCLHLGSERDVSMRGGLPYDFVERIEEADFILNTGSADEAGTMAATPAVLQAAAKRGLPMVCANPDRVVISHGRREPCAGAIAEAYERLGGQVRYHGKPYPEVYARALEKLGVRRARVLCVGDGMETDMKGAAAAGLDSLFILGGIHHEELGGVTDGVTALPTLRELAARWGVSPMAALVSFTW